MEQLIRFFREYEGLGPGKSTSGSIESPQPFPGIEEKEKFDEWSKEQSELHEEAMEFMIKQLRGENDKLKSALAASERFRAEDGMSAINREASLQQQLTQAREALNKIAQMSDPGSYEKAIVDMKRIAADALIASLNKEK